jgi:hypothetical protein
MRVEPHHPWSLLSSGAYQPCPTPDQTLAGAASDPSGGDGGSGGELGSFKWGVAVEVMSAEEGARGCWVPAEVLRVESAESKLLVAWLAETDPPNATTSMERARPVPLSSDVNPARCLMLCCCC